MLACKYCGNGVYVSKSWIPGKGEPVYPDPKHRQPGTKRIPPKDDASKKPDKK